jgi:hypothetical protein
MIVKIRFNTNTKCLAGGSLIILLYHLHAEQVHRLNYCPKDKKEDSKKRLGKFHVEFHSCQNTIFCTSGGFYYNYISFAFQI